MAEENKLQEMIRSSLESIRTMVDANTVVGTPIETKSGTTIIPISKVSVGYASGGLDYDGKAKLPPKNFAGGGGTGLSVQPVCFICVKENGETELLPLGNKGESDSVEKIAALIEKAPELFGKVKKIFGKKKKEKGEEGNLEKLSKEAAQKAFDATSDVIEAFAEADEKAEAAEKNGKIAKEANEETVG